MIIIMAFEIEEMKLLEKKRIYRKIHSQEQSGTFFLNTTYTLQVSIIITILNLTLLFYLIHYEKKNIFV